MRHLLDVPSEPRRQRTVLVVVVHRREIPPRWIAAEDLYQAGLEVDPEPLPAQHEEAEARRRIARAESRPKAAWRAEVGQETRLQEHPVRLVGRENLQRSDTGEKQQRADRDRQSRPDIEHEKSGSGDPSDDDEAQHRVGRVDPEDGWRVPEALDRTEH